MKDKSVAKALRDKDHFQAMCMQVEAVRPWVDPANAAPISRAYS